MEKWPSLSHRQVRVPTWGRRAIRPEYAVSRIGGPSAVAAAAAPAAAITAATSHPKPLIALTYGLASGRGPQGGEVVRPAP